MRRLHAWLFVRGKAPTDPAAVVPGPRRGRKLPATFNEREMGRLLEPRRPADGPRALRDLAMLEAMYGCGLRAAEICALRLRDLDRHEWTLRVTGKGDKQRIVPVGRPAAAALSRYLERGRTALAGRRGLRPVVRQRARPAAPRLGRAPHPGRRRCAARGSRSDRRTPSGTHSRLISWKEVPI